MSVRLSENAGFCPGVRRADIAVKKLIAERRNNEKIYTLGALIHNNIYTAELERLGIAKINFEEIEELIKSEKDILHTLLVRTHGIPLEQQRFLENLTQTYSNFRFVDMTCPSVKKIHRIAAQNTSDETVFLLFCNKTHPEAVGIMSPYVCHVALHLTLAAG